jgi:hypothetical protein
MSARNSHDVLALRAVARVRSFTRAVTLLGDSRSALSQTIRCDRPRSLAEAGALPACLLDIKFDPADDDGLTDIAARAYDAVCASASRPHRT